MLPRLAYLLIMAENMFTVRYQMLITQWVGGTIQRQDTSRTSQVWA